MSPLLVCAIQHDDVMPDVGQSVLRVVQRDSSISEQKPSLKIYKVDGLKSCDQERHQQSSAQHAPLNPILIIDKMNCSPSWVTWICSHMTTRHTSVGTRAAWKSFATIGAAAGRLRILSRWPQTLNGSHIAEAQHAGRCT